MITWNETLATGNARVDAQHKALLEKFNDLSVVFSGTSNAKIRLAAGEVLDYLLFYARWHFEQEELIMAEVHCPLAELNKSEHRDFLKRIGDFYLQWQTGNMDLELARNAYAAMEQWVVHHITHVDSALRENLQEKDQPA